MFNLNRSDANTIDQVLFHLHAGSSSRTELQRLGDLFVRRAFLGQLATILRSASTSPYTPYVRVTVQLAWIDKRPYLESASTPKQWPGKVELGDAAVFFIDEIRSHPRSRAAAHVVSASGLILQAKRTTPFSPTLPVVPVHTDASSVKQYAFLSSWPQVDLYRSTSTHSQILAGLSFAGIAATSRLGWYVVTPNASPSDMTGAPGRYAYIAPYGGVWRSPWVGAPPVKGNTCDATLGEMLVTFFGQASGGTVPTYPAPLGAGIGQTFDLVRGWTAAKVSGQGWDDLCNALLNMKNEKIGKHGGAAAGNYKNQRILAFCHEPYLMGGFVGGVTAMHDDGGNSQGGGGWRGGEDEEDSAGFPILTVRRTSFQQPLVRD